MILQIRKKKFYCKKKQKFKNQIGSSRRGSAVTNLTGIHEDVGSIPGLAQ